MSCTDDLFGEGRQGKKKVWLGRTYYHYIYVYLPKEKYK
jgi:hypothetical protein